MRKLKAANVPISAVSLVLLPRPVNGPKGTSVLNKPADPVADGAIDSRFGASVNFTTALC
jgi:hypothetical protein